MSARFVLPLVLACPVGLCWAQPAPAAQPADAAHGSAHDPNGRSALWSSIEAQHRTPAAVRAAARKRLSADERALLREQVRGGYAIGMVVTPIAAPAPIPAAPISGPSVRRVSAMPAAGEGPAPLPALQPAAVPPSHAPAR